MRSDQPFVESYVNAQSAEDAYKSVIAGAGAGGASETGWDYIDARYIQEVTKGTYTYTGSKQGLKGIIDSRTMREAIPIRTTSSTALMGCAMRRMILTGTVCRMPGRSSMG